MFGSKRPHLSRREFILSTATLLGSALTAPLLAGCRTEPTPTVALAVPTAAPAKAEPTTAPTKAEPTKASEEKAVSDFGVEYPPDAAPKEYQFTVSVADQSTAPIWKCMDINEAVYARAPLAGFFSEPLVRLDNNFGVVPAQAENWRVAEDGVTWTFVLRKGLMWSDGNEVTANDYVTTFRYMADPEHAYDFVWYWQNVIKNFKECAQGTVPLEELGVRKGADDFELVVETYEPIPYLPGMMLYSSPLSKAGLEKFGSGAYNTNPETCISCGPYVLEEWSPDRRFVIKANPNYKGTLKPYINRMVANVVSGGDNLSRYLAGEVDWISIGPVEIERIGDDPELKAQIKTSSGDFRCYYSFFDVNVPPWNDVRVREAFSRSVDREAIVDNILAPLAISAYSFLMPGFPDANRDGLKDLQMYDPEKAKSLLAAAGYPEGNNFPATTLWVRGAGPDRVAQAVVASITQTLGVPVSVEYRDDRVWTEMLLKKPSEIPFGYVSYGMDYFDATNMLGVWLTGGRHTWSNPEFDKLVKEGGRITDDMAERSRQMQEAERILVSEYPAIFVYHSLGGQLHKPYRMGEHLKPNKFGYDGIQWAAEEATHGLGYNNLYMSQDVVEMRKIKPEW